MGVGGWGGGRGRWLGWFGVGVGFYGVGVSLLAQSAEYNCSTLLPEI